MRSDLKKKPHTNTENVKLIKKLRKRQTFLLYSINIIDTKQSNKKRRERKSKFVTQITRNRSLSIKRINWAKELLKKRREEEFPYFDNIIIINKMSPTNKHEINRALNSLLTLTISHSLFPPSYRLYRESNRIKDYLQRLFFSFHSKDRYLIDFNSLLILNNNNKLLAWNYKKGELN